MKVEVVRSARRRKTVQAWQAGDLMRISIPASMSKDEETRWVAEMVGRIERKVSASGVDLSGRAAALAGRHGLEIPFSIRWVDNQEWRWGSCTPADGTIRISSRLATEPPWVIDYVIVHELAHLTVSGHGKAFWDLVYRYPLTERARGFLIARSWEPAEPDGSSPDPVPIATIEESYPLAGTLF
jgi:predicted metal-dependent hydrolase